MSAVNNSTFANKKPVLEGDNVMSGVTSGTNEIISITGATNFGTTVGTTELVRDTVAISLSSPLNSVSCFVITSIGANGGTRVITFRIRLDDVNGTIIGTFAIGNTVAQLVKMQAVLSDIPNTTTQIVLTRQFTGIGESGTTILSGGDNLYVTVTESTDTHNTKNTNIIRG